MQLGGQTPLGLAARLKAAGVPVVGTSPEAIHLAEDRGEFGRVLTEAGLLSPKHGTARSYDEASAIAADIGYPVLVRPSYVLGGRGMEIVYDEASLRSYVERATDASPEHPILVDRFLDDAVEVDVDALYDGEQLYLAGVMEHIEEAGIHSGDSACALPPITLGRSDIARIREATEGIARGVGVRGLLNVQFALQSDVLYVIEANPRASRTVPFVAKATGVSAGQGGGPGHARRHHRRAARRGAAARPGTGRQMPLRSHVAVKEAVLPFNRFVGVDTVLGPEMKSTGEVMGIDAGFGVAYAKSQAAAYGTLPTKGRVFVSVANRDKRAMVFPVKRLVDLGFEVLATDGTAEMLDRNGVRATVVPKYSEGLPGNAVERILAGEIDLVINTPFSTSGNTGPRVDGYEIRSACVAHEVPCVTTVQGASAAVQGIEAVHPRRPRRQVAAGVERRARRSCGGRGGRADADPGPERLGPADREARLLPPAAGRRAGDRRGGPARALRRLRGRRRRRRAAAAPRVLHLRVGEPVRRRHGRRHLLRRRRRNALAGRATAGDRLDVVGPLGHPFPLPTEAGALRPGRRRLRRRPAVPAGRGAAQAGLPGRHGARRRDRGPAVRRAGRQAGLRHRRHHHRRRVRRHARPGHRRARARSWNGPTWSTPAARCRCSPRSASAPCADDIPTHVAVEEAMACGIGVCMTCVLPVRGIGRGAAHGAVLRRGAGLPRRRGAVRRHRDHPGGSCLMTAT